MEGVERVGVGCECSTGRYESPVVPDARTWQRDMAEAFRDPVLLLTSLGLDAALSPYPIDPSPRFPMLVPRDFAARMQPGRWDDPLLLQVLPQQAELQPAAGFGTDAVGDGPARKAPGLLHKYPGRALLTLSPLCAVHCRYCFRREYPYAEVPKTADTWEPAFAYLASRPDVHEVILSGGDPLFLDDRKLATVLERLRALPHLRSIRIHTRLPIVLPSRVHAGLVELLAGAEPRTVVVVHANHARELEGDCARALEDLRRAGLMLLNQAVLLRGVNDSLESLRALSLRLGELGVMPYYLHQLDRVQGTQGFEVDEARGRELVRGLRESLPGYLVPRYVREVPGELSKTGLI